jgi:hypothetical protein
MRPAAIPPPPVFGGISSPPRFPAALELPGSPFVQCPVFASDSLPLPLPALHLAFLAFLAFLAGLGVSTTFVGLDGGQSPVASATGASPPSATVAAIAAAVIRRLIILGPFLESARGRPAPERTARAPAPIPPAGVSSVDPPSG